MVRNVLRLVLAINSVSKALNRVEKIPILCVVNSNPMGFTVHVNSNMNSVHEIFLCENVFS